MRTLGMTLSLAGFALLGACSRGSDAHPDDALKNDLALAAQAQPYTAQQFIGPNEQTPGATAPAAQYNAAPRAAQPVRRAPAPVYRSSRSSGRSTSRSSGTYYPSVPSAAHASRCEIRGVTPPSVRPRVPSLAPPPAATRCAAVSSAPLPAESSAASSDIPWTSRNRNEKWESRPRRDPSQFPLHERLRQCTGGGVRALRGTLLACRLGDGTQ